MNANTDRPSPTYAGSGEPVPGAGASGVMTSRERLLYRSICPSALQTMTPSGKSCISASRIAFSSSARRRERVTASPTFACRSCIRSSARLIAEESSRICRRPLEGKAVRRVDEVHQVDVVGEFSERFDETPEDPERSNDRSQGEEERRGEYERGMVIEYRPEFGLFLRRKCEPEC